MRKLFYIVVAGGIGFFVWNEYLKPLPKINLNANVINNANPKKVVGDAIEDAPMLPAKYYVLYSSASWCGPCRQAAPKMIDWYRGNAIEGEVAFVMVSYDESEAKAIEYIKSTGMPWPFIMSHNLPNDILKQGGDGIPNTLVTDRWGQVLATSGTKRKYEGPFKPLAAIKPNPR